jgi:3-oxoacyl-[acyl-carrier protein] reductase
LRSILISLDLSGDFSVEEATMMDFRLQDKVALVTGASGNLGRAIGLALAQSGASVALLYGSARSSQPTEEYAQELARLYQVKTMALHGDVRSEASMVAAVSEVVAKFGLLSILVNNAGVFTVGLQEALAEEDWDTVMDTNVKGIWRTCRLAIKYLRETRGTVVNICSINALHPGFGGTAHYDASKGAVAAYTRSLAKELAPDGIRVNAVAPGLIMADSLRADAPDLMGLYERRAALGRLVNPAEVASVVCFLASEAASAMTGEVLAADCGYVMM